MSETYAVGDRIWRWRKGDQFSKRPAVIVKVSTASGEVTSISSKSRDDAVEQPQVHRIIRGGATGARKMKPIEAERAADLEEWRRLKFVIVESDRDLVVWTVAMSRYSDVSLESIPRLRAELDIAEQLLRREAARAEATP